ncbi:MAG: hypothetical protein O3A81_03095 [bacterium]|nr:hypothetical protein [bacterium]
MALTPILPEAIPTSAASAASTEIATVHTNTAAQTATLSNTVPMSAGVAEAVSMGPLSAPVLGTLATTAFLVGGLFFAYKGIQMVVTGKNSFRKTA